MPMLIDYSPVFKRAATAQIAQLSIPISSWRRKAFKSRLGLVLLIMFVIIMYIYIHVYVCMYIYIYI